MITKNLGSSNWLNFWLWVSRLLVSNACWSILVCLCRESFDSFDAPDSSEILIRDLISWHMGAIFSSFTSTSKDVPRGLQMSVHPLWPFNYRISLYCRDAQLWSLLSAGWSPFCVRFWSSMCTLISFSHDWKIKLPVADDPPLSLFIFGSCSLQTSYTTICISYPDWYIVGVIWLALAFSFCEAENVTFPHFSMIFLRSRCLNLPPAQ